MATILNIETSTNVCSVALTADGFILEHFEDFEGPNHASVISDFISECIKHLQKYEIKKPDAIAVSIGPGSYTGLRIGLSEAKGLAYGYEIPLIAVNTLEIIAVETMFQLTDFDVSTDIFQPMIDARRNEVYTASYDGYLQSLSDPHPVILTNDFNNNILADKRIIYCGNGAVKAETLITPSVQSLFFPEVVPLATGMLPLSEKAWRNKEFVDIAYSIPLYLKEFQASTPKNKLS